MCRIVFLYLIVVFFLIHPSVYGSGTAFHLLHQTLAQNKASYSKASKEPETETIETTIKPHRKNALFDANHPVKYDVTLFNHYKDTQEGKVTIEVKTAQGGVVGISEVDFKVKPGAKKTVQWAIPVENPGFYDLNVRINLTEYDDTIRRVFGYRPYEINTPLHKPDDFDAFWQKAKDDLNAINPNYEITPDDILSTPTHRVYLVEMTSLENVRVYGWLTVPRVKGKFPVMYGLGGYRVEMHPLFYDDFIGFTINVRGIGESSKVINPDRKEQIVLNIEDKNKYVYRGIYMDCLRGLDFILTHQDMGFDISKIGCLGGSQGGTLALIVAAMSKKILFCVVDNPTFCDFRTNFEICTYRPVPGYFIETLKDYLKRHSSFTKENMLRNLSYFEAQNFVSQIECPILLGGGLLDLFAPPTCTISAFNKLNENVKRKSESYFFPNLAHEVTTRHNVFKATWFNEKTIKKLPQ